MKNLNINNQVSLDSIPIGSKCKVTFLKADGSIRRRLLDLGIINGTEIESISKSPSGNLVAYLIRGAVIALRSDDASKVMVENIFITE